MTGEHLAARQRPPAGGARPPRLPAHGHARTRLALPRIGITLGLEVVALVLFMYAAALRFLNYAVYCGVIAAAALLLVDLPQPSSHGTEGDRVYWTLCGVGMG